MSEQKQIYYLLKKNFEKLFPGHDIIEIILSLKYLRFEEYVDNVENNCVCGKEIKKLHFFSSSLDKEEDKKEYILGSKCIEHYYNKDNLKFENLAKALKNKCYGCKKYVLTKTEKKKPINNKICKACKINDETYIRGKCGHPKLFKDIKIKGCEICKYAKEQKKIKKQREKEEMQQKLKREKEEMQQKLEDEKFDNELLEYEKLGIYKKCVDCRKYKTHNKFTHCWTCYIKYKKKCNNCDKLIDKKYNLCFNCYSKNR